MNGRHYIEPAVDPYGEPFPPGRGSHVMRSSYPSDVRVTRYPLPTEAARTHASSLNQNDADDLRVHGQVQQ